LEFFEGVFHGGFRLWFLLGLTLDHGLLVVKGYSPNLRLPFRNFLEKIDNKRVIPDDA
jgi:hypothetical protein